MFYKKSKKHRQCSDRPALLQYKGLDLDLENYSLRAVVLFSLPNSTLLKRKISAVVVETVDDGLEQKVYI